MNLFCIEGPKFTNNNGAKIDANPVLIPIELTLVLTILKLLIKKNSLFCLKCRKKTENKHPRVTMTDKGRVMLLSKSAVCNRRSRFIKKQEASRLLSSLGLRTPISKISLSGNILF